MQYNEKKKTIIEEVLPLTLAAWEAVSFRLRGTQKGSIETGRLMLEWEEDRNGTGNTFGKRNDEDT